jgi:hypothetical protein
MPRPLLLLFCFAGCTVTTTPQSKAPRIVVEAPPADTGMLDSDGDGLSDTEEEQLGLDPNARDTDGDGLSDLDELAWGSDPTVADTDGDGLLDGEEVELGCDPTLVDTDEDSYTDFDEVLEGTDPTDAKSRIYEGSWPYLASKDDIDAPEWNSRFGIGEVFPRFEGHDQFGDKVDLYDFAGQDRPVLLYVAAAWCGPCYATADWLSGGGDDYYDGTYPDLRDAVDSGEVTWITVLTDDFSGAPASKQAVREWHESYPHDLVPVLEDGGYDVVDHIQLPGWPSLVALDDKMEVTSVPTDDTVDLLDALGL